MARKRIVIMGAAGRDFHNFNTFFRDRSEYEVVAFTATQIPGIGGRLYPPNLAGELYPKGISIRPEEELTQIIKKENIHAVIFAYSDVSYQYVMHRASQVVAAGADFWLQGNPDIRVKSTKPVLSVCAVRTGCGKSQTSRKLAKLIKQRGHRVVAVRHAMPYGNLAKQSVQRFAMMQDLDIHDCTVEEREEYEPYIVIGCPVFAGVDYEAILRKAEKEADIIIWDGGNNDFPFFSADLKIVVTDPHRVGDEFNYYPGEVNLLDADVVLINKIDSADPVAVQKLKSNITSVNTQATLIEAESPLFVENSEQIRGKKVLVIEDGPTVTHGGMLFGAGTLAAKKYGASEIIDPRPWLSGKIKQTFETYPNIGKLLPAMGYGAEQIEDLERTIAAVPCDLVVIGTPIDLNRVLKINQPSVRVRYELQEIGTPDLNSILDSFFECTSRDREVETGRL